MMSLLWRKLPIGQVLGIPLYLHSSFLLLVVVAVLGPLLAGTPVNEVVRSSLLMLVLFLCVILHELGHALSARAVRISTRDITLMPFGGIASLEKMPERPRDEVLVAVAGPLVNLVIAGLIFLLSHGLRIHLPLGKLFMDVFPWEEVMWMNVTLGLFNLAPAFPMDGGRVLRALLSLVVPGLTATRIAMRIGQGLAIVLAGVGVFYNPMLLAVAGFVLYAGSSEMHMQLLRLRLREVAVATAMQRGGAVFDAVMPISQAVAQLFLGPQREFSVSFNGRYVGWVTRDDLVKAVSEQERDVPVWQVMRRDVLRLSPDASLQDALMVLERAGASVLPVVSEGVPVGVLSLENVREHVFREYEPLEEERIQARSFGAGSL